jgi:predicted O-linked N-acetylglucosamine transferase (SPINDLY family)
MASLSQMVETAMGHHQAGRLDAAEGIYRQVLATNPQQPDALHFLGLLLHQRGRQAEAIESIRQAIALLPGNAVYRANLGEVYRVAGAIPQALECFGQAVQLKPDFADAWRNMGHALREQGRLDAAVIAYRRAVALGPNIAGYHDSLGVALADQGQLDEAVNCFRRALAVEPDRAETLCKLGSALAGLGQLDAAMDCFRQTLAVEPDQAEMLCKVGMALAGQGQFDEGSACYRRALALQPDWPEAEANLGLLLQRQGKLEEAVACYRRSVERAPELAIAHNNLGLACWSLGQGDEALQSFREALRLDPNFSTAHSNLIFTLLSDPGTSQRMLDEELRRFQHAHAAPLAAAIKPHTNDRSSDRRLRVGYVSGDFRSHPVAQFVLPLLEAHDPQTLEVFGYSAVQTPDAMTARCRAATAAWRDVRSLSDERLAELVREDRIDILVDLALHTAENRLLAFARKPAPVQVSWLGYPGSTGLDAIDFWLTDPYLDPPRREDGSTLSGAVRLPETYWCYRPAADTENVSSLPALEAGRVTFGSLNNYGKLNAATLALWGRLLQVLPKSQLVLHAPVEEQRRRARRLLAEQGVSAERVRFTGFLPLAEYFQVYRQIDIGLDPFPYGGGTTTCDALWMGVPVVSLAGQTAVGRGGLSLLSNMGLPELVAADETQYVAIAAGLAGDLPRLAKLRASLRERMWASPLTNAPRFARHIEAAYRAMWHWWCEEDAQRRSASITL